MIKRTIRKMLRVDASIIFTDVLPDELNLIIFQFLPMTDLILSISNVCQSWRRDYCFPLILNYLRQVDHNIGKDHENNDVESGSVVALNEFSDLFKTRIGRSLMRRSLRERLYRLACQIIDGIMMDPKVKNNLHKFRGQLQLNGGGVGGHWWNLYREEWELLIEQFKGFRDLKDKFDMVNKQKEIVTTITTDDSTTDKKHSVVSGLLNYLSSFFTKQNDSKATTINNNTSAASNSSLKKRNYNSGFKCVMVGESNVGKTSFVNCLVKHLPCSEVDPWGSSSVSASFFSQRYTLGDGSLISLEMWDPAGSERYRTMPPIYYRGGNVAFCMFDLGQQKENQSFKSIERAVEDITKYSLKKECEMILIGNKNDKLKLNGGGCDDLSSLTQISRMKALSLSLNEMDGALYVEMNNMDIKYAHSISLYAAMMIYMINGGLR